ncbi:MAG: family 16 glycosylhydrolase [Verrucomicrobiales bacterium]
MTNQCSALLGRSLLGLFLSTAGFSPAAEPVASPPEAIPAELREDYKLVWQDEFNGTTLDPKKWRVRGEGVNRKLGVVSGKTISLDGKGNCVISVLKGPDGKNLIGQIATQGLFDPTYGYFECRAKMNRSIGPHVAFWLQSPTLGKTGDPAVDGSEVDIFEFHRRAPDTVHHCVHWDGYGEKHKMHGNQAIRPNIGEGFHTFGLLWTPKEYVFYVNGKETWRTDKAVSRRSLFIILSTELSGWGGDIAKGKLPDQVVFDYVRVYQQK